jgi:hypothetical protein
MGGKEAFGMVQVSGMEQSEGIRIRTSAIRTQCLQVVKGMIVISLVWAADKKLSLSKTLGEETEHNRVSFSLRFV